MDDLFKPLDEESIMVTIDDFEHACQEIVPAFGASIGDLERCRVNGIVECGQRHKHIYQRAMLLVEQVKLSKGSPLVTCLSEGLGGTGKSAAAATIGIDSNLPYVKIISAETMVGLSESSKCARIVKVLQGLNVFAEDDIDSAAEALHNMPMKKLYMLVEMSAQGANGGNAGAIYSGREKINLNHFYDILSDVIFIR